MQLGMLHVTPISPSLTAFCMCNISKSPNSVVLAFSSSLKTITSHKVIIHWCGLGSSRERCVTGSQTILVPYLLGLAAILGAFLYLPWCHCHFPCFICMAAASIEFPGSCLTPWQLSDPAVFSQWDHGLPLAITAWLLLSNCLKNTISGEVSGRKILIPHYVVPHYQSWILRTWFLLKDLMK